MSINDNLKKEFGISARVDNKIGNEYYFKNNISKYAIHNNDITLSHAWKTYSKLISEISKIDISTDYIDKQVELNPYISDEIILEHMFNNVEDYFKYFNNKEIKEQFILKNNNYTNYFYIANIFNRTIKISLQPVFNELNNVKIEYKGDNLFQIYGELKQNFIDDKSKLPDFSSSKAVINIDGENFDLNITCDYRDLKGLQNTLFVNPNLEIQKINDNILRQFYNETSKYEDNFISISPGSIIIKNKNILPLEFEFDLYSRYSVNIENTEEFISRGVYEISETTLNPGKNIIKLKINNIPQGMDKCFFTINISNVYKYQVDINFDVSYFKNIQIQCFNNKNGYFIDNTFKFEKYLFDKENILDNWVDKSQFKNILYVYNNVNSHYFEKLIIKDLFKDEYLKGQKNIWEIYNHKTGELICQLYNDCVSYLFNYGLYDVKLKAYDIFGNTITQKKEGIVNIYEN